MAITKHIYFDIGEDFFTTISLRDEDGLIVNLEDQQFYCDFRKIFSASPSFSANCVVQTELEELHLSVDSSQTVDLQPGKYQYDILMVDENNKHTKILEGLLFLGSSSTVRN